MKYSFSLLELIFAIVLISLITTQTTYKIENHNLKDAADKVKLYLNYTRYIAHIDNKFDIYDEEWRKKLWTLKFQNCKSSVGGLYYVVYSDRSGGTAHFKKEECLKDPLSDKFLYSNSDCQVSSDESRYILLTKEFGIEKVQVSCNTTSTIGQISFADDGKVYSSLGSNPKEITNKCNITLYDSDNESITITIEPKTGFIY